MKKSSFFWAYPLLLLCLISLALILIFPLQITSKSTFQESYTFTKAICDKNNYCEDYEIACEQKKVKKFTPTGFAIQNEDSWQDPRTPEQIEKMCD